jgi:hypothetical protein
MGRTASGRLALLLVLGLLVQGGVVACNTTAMLRPPVVSTSLPDGENRQLIVESLKTQGWSVLAEKPGEIIARYVKQTHVAQVRVLYDDAGIRIVYASSQDLKCDPVGDSCAKIHKAYNTWVQSLYEDILARVQARS